MKVDLTKKEAILRAPELQPGLQPQILESPWLPKKKKSLKNPKKKKKYSKKKKSPKKRKPKKTKKRKYRRNRSRLKSKVKGGMEAAMEDAPAIEEPLAMGGAQAVVEEQDMDEDAPPVAVAGVEQKVYGIPNPSRPQLLEFLEDCNRIGKRLNEEVADEGPRGLQRNAEYTPILLDSITRSDVEGRPGEWDPLKKYMAWWTKNKVQYDMMYPPSLPHLEWLIDEFVQHNMLNELKGSDLAELRQRARAANVEEAAIGVGINAEDITPPIKSAVAKLICKAETSGDATLLDALLKKASTPVVKDILYFPREERHLDDQARRQIKEWEKADLKEQTLGIFIKEKIFTMDDETEKKILVDKWGERAAEQMLGDESDESSEISQKKKYIRRYMGYVLDNLLQRRFANIQKFKEKALKGGDGKPLRDQETVYLAYFDGGKLQHPVFNDDVRYFEQINAIQYSFRGGGGLARDEKLRDPQSVRDDLTTSSFNRYKFVQLPLTIEIDPMENIRRDKYRKQITDHLALEDGAQDALDASVILSILLRRQPHHCCAPYDISLPPIPPPPPGMGGMAPPVHDSYNEIHSKDIHVRNIEADKMNPIQWGAAGGAAGGGAAGGGAAGGGAAGGGAAGGGAAGGGLSCEDYCYQMGQQQIYQLYTANADKLSHDAEKFTPSMGLKTDEQ
jgi:hypothetical protein